MNIWEMTTGYSNIFRLFFFRKHGMCAYKVNVLTEMTSE